MRVNIIAQLAATEAVLGAAREAPLVRSMALGQFGWRHLLIAEGELPAPVDSEEPPPEMSTIEAAFLDCELDELQATGDALGQSVESLDALDAQLMEKVGAAQAPNLSELRDFLVSAGKRVNEQLQRRGAGVSGEPAEESTEPGEGQAVVQRIAGEITSRDDVLRMLTKICDYYARHEPASPVPLLLERAKRMLAMNFLDILRDLAPDGVSQAETVLGKSEEEEEEE